MSFKEHSLRNPTVQLFFFSNLQRIIFQKEANFDLPDSFFFNGSFNCTFFEISVKPKHVFVQFDESWLKPNFVLILLDFSFLVVFESGMSGGSVVRMLSSLLVRDFQRFFPRQTVVAHLRFLIINLSTKSRFCSCFNADTRL